ncbi:hypothetical protein A9P82_13680 [Arachidicoccus ginsenosidimutans]|uniref:RagB/SusD family nutrient uptake outer membrane protein n=1 Tax=Arachidicoccus sp. BS20 TaxID=1850526 RepID=UPI0007F14950|nr:RagB/SusD family nutrient uptake outer membrane protein [Arachidicoccus sp. BS20]ANI90248.1 hypothetical protein A9P82_13680 [Arachidicoccus sp. BS20]
MKKYLIILTGLLALSSCNKWLNITPQSQVSSDDLYKTQEGFEEALNGVYTRCSQDDLYGNELSTGFLDVLAQDFTISTQNDAYGYLQTQKFNYTDANFISRKDNTWNGLYNAIVNANLILENIDQKKSVFSNPDEYAMIKGEALALRAYLHFDVFRMFGSSFSSTGAPEGIPYVTTYSNKVTKTSSPQDVMKAIITDLDSAKMLLKPVDPIVKGTYVIDYPGSDSSTENSNPSLFLQDRRNRLNYYAVCGELARAYLYEGDKSNALANALEVIQSNKFPWTKSADLINSDPSLQDKIMYKEILFGWYCPWESQSLLNRFLSGGGGVFASQDDMQYIYETNGIGGEDNRAKAWFQTGLDQNMIFEKYARNQAKGTSDDNSVNLYPQTIPALRLSEMYYIAAECSYDSSPQQALEYFDDVRENRGIGTPLSVSSKSQFTGELIKEARKEFYGEGQIFYMYKRLNQSIVGHSGSLISPSDKIFVLPLPNDEVEFGNR